MLPRSDLHPLQERVLHLFTHPPVGQLNIASITELGEFDNPRLSSKVCQELRHLGWLESVGPGTYKLTTDAQSELLPVT